MQTASERVGVLLMSHYTELNFPEISDSNWKGKTRKSSLLPDRAFLSQQKVRYILNSISFYNLYNYIYMHFYYINILV